MIEMARNNEWAENWKDYVGQLNKLAMIPNLEDSERVMQIVKELNVIIDRNTKESD